jgi:hypothetical protein
MFDDTTSEAGNPRWEGVVMKLQRHKVTTSAASVGIALVLMGSNVRSEARQASSSTTSSQTTSTLDQTPSGQIKTPALATPVAPKLQAATPLMLLDQARQALDAMNDQFVKSKGGFGGSMEKIRQNFADMAKLYRQGTEPPLSTWAPSVSNPFKNTKLYGDWRENFSEIERQLTYLIGGGPSMEPGTTGTAGVAGVAVTTDEDAFVKSESPDARHQLEEFRRQLELFYVATIDQTGVSLQQGVTP